MMRNTFLKASAAAAVVLVAGLTACNNDSLTQVNANPNAPEHVSSATLFTNATLTTMQTLRGTSFEHGLSALWVQHYAEIQYPEADINVPRGSTVEGLWSALYSGPLQDFTQVLTQSTIPNQTAPALVMRAFLVESITDLWGDVPFTEASKGSANLTPKYDPQSVVYDSIFASLKSAVGMMTTGTTDTYGGADPVYAGNMAKWIKLANSLHARAAMRLSQVNSGATAKAELAAALAGPVFTSNADNALITYPGGTIPNPLCANWTGCAGTRDDQRISRRFIDTLKVTGDPRLFKYAMPTAASQSATPTACDTTYRGFPNGLNSANIPNTCTGKNYSLSDYSRPTTSIRSQTSPSYIMTYSELLFIKAEAAERGWITGSAASYYTQAITASMQQWGVADTAIATYLARPNVVYTPGANGLKQIAYEKWVSLFNLEIEAYSEWRRLNYPVLVPGRDAVTNYVPTRLPYPAIENSLNATNLAAATAAQGDVTISGHVWWDK